MWKEGCDPNSITCQACHRIGVHEIDQSLLALPEPVIMSLTKLNCQPRVRGSELLELP